MPAFSKSLISVGWLFLNSGALSEEALPPAVASFNVCSQVSCVCLFCLSVSLSLSSSPFLLLFLSDSLNAAKSPLRFHYFSFSHICLLFSILSLSFPFMCVSLTPIPFLFLLISIPSFPPASDWQCYKLIFSPVCSLCLSLGIFLI